MIEVFLQKLKSWSARQSDILAVVLIGSWARGTARTDSDIDIVIISTNPTKLLTEQNWLSELGSIKSITREDWGLMQSLRVIYMDGREIEFGITTKQWISEDEIELDTGKILSNGAQIIFDRYNLFASLIPSLKHIEGTEGN